MTDPTTVLMLAVAGVTALAIVTIAAARGWAGWLELQRQMLGTAPGREPATPMAARIELADLRERIRRLEAIAAGVDL